MISSVIRIVLAVAAVVVVLGVGIRILLSQPSLSGLAFRGSRHADQGRMRHDVEFLTGAASPRDVQHRENLERAADYISQEFERAGARVGQQPFQTRRGKFRNVLARFGPSVGKPIVVGAHYDAFGEFGLNPGADDNASGVAGLLELARVLEPRRLGSPVQVVAYATEEPPFFGSPEMGSAVHVRGLSAAGDMPRAMICLEMIGYYRPNQEWPSPLFRLLYPADGKFIAVVGRWSDRRLARLVKRAFVGATALPMYSYGGPIIAGMDASDHRSYWAAGVPAVMITDTAFLRNPNYHAPGDTAETLHFENMAAVVDGVANALYWSSNQ